MNQVDQQKAHYNRYFTSAEAVAQRQDSFKRHFLAAAVRHLSLTTEDQILELGCGHGVLTEHLLASGCKVTAIDLSGAGLATLRSAFTDEIAVGRLLTQEIEINSFLETTTNTYDCICGSGILHHLPDLELTLRLAKQRLVPGGRLFFGPEPNASGIYGLAWRYLAQPISRLFGSNFDWEVEKNTLNITIRNLHQVLDTIGYQQIEIRPYQVIPHFNQRVLRKLDTRLINTAALAPVAIYLAVYAKNR